MGLTDLLSDFIRKAYQRDFMLTHRQNQLLYYIHHQISKRGVSPSYEEMKNAIGLSSKSGIHRIIQGLEERGYIKRLSNKARAVEIIKLPIHQTLEDQTEHASISRNALISASKPEALHTSPASHSSMIEIPVLGYIAAGVPIEAIQDELDRITVPSGLSISEDAYALKIKGDSMINAGILEDDIVIIKPCSTAHSGEIIVALIDQTEASLKYFYQKGDRIALKAANPDYQTRLFPYERITIQGKLIGLYRQY